MTGRARVMGVTLAAALVAVVGTSLYLMGSPADERARRLDDRRVQDLERISNALDVYWSQNGVLPASLGAVQQQQGGQLPLDPVTESPYGYRVTAGVTFDLCAQFDREAESEDQVLRTPFRSHRAGQQCFRREVRKVP